MDFKKGLLGLAALTASVLAAGQGISVTIDEKPVRFTAGQPQMINGRVLVPLRGIFEALGAYITWVPSTQTVIAQSGSVDLQLRIGERTALVNGRSVTLDVPAQIINGSTMVPLRFVGESLGADVKWNGQSQTVLIYTTGSTNQQNTMPTQPPINNPGILPTVTSITVDSDPWVRSGRDVRIVLTGSPGGQASFEIPGVTRGRVQMREETPGRYVGTWRPVGDENISGASVLGYLSLGGQERIIQAGQNLSVDVTPPKIRNIIPDRARLSNPRPTIGVLFDDQGGSGLDPDSVVLRVNGVDHSRQAQLNDNFLTFTPRGDLPSGENRVEVTARDKAGNEVRGAWTFTIASVSDVVRTLTHNANRALEPGDTMQVTLVGEPGGTATFSIGRSVVDRPMREVSPGQYVGEYVIRKGDVFTNEPVTATLATRNGMSFNIEAQDRVGLNTGPLAAPVITGPAADARVGGTFAVQGTAAPNAQVRVRIEYAAQALGLLNLTGAVYDRVVTADNQGRWSTGDIRVEGIAGSRGARYTVTATAVGADGRESEATTLRLVRQ